MPVALRIVFCAIGACVFVLSLWIARANARAQSWPSTSGRIVRSELEPDQDGEISARVEYAYQVRKKSYVSTQIAYAVFRNDLPAKLKRVAQFHEGKQVEVFYDPRDPGKAVLMREPSSLWLAAAATGLAFAAIGVFAP